MGSIIYKGLVITPTPKQLTESFEWTLEVLIKKSHESGCMVCPFSTNDTFKTRKKAEAAAFKFAIRIINNKVPECSLRSCAKQSLVSEGCYNHICELNGKPSTFN